MLNLRILSKRICLASWVGIFDGIRGAVQVPASANGLAMRAGTPAPVSCLLSLRGIYLGSI